MSIMFCTDDYSNFNYMEATGIPMDSQKDDFPFLPSVLFLSKVHKPRPTSIKCLSLRNAVMWSILWGWNKIECTLHKPRKWCHYYACFLLHFYLTSGILTTQHALTVIDFWCQRVIITKSHTNKTATWLCMEYMRTTLVGEILTVQGQCWSCSFVGLSSVKSAQHSQNIPLQQHKMEQCGH
jgi:hypothetical protein